MNDLCDVMMYRKNIFSLDRICTTRCVREGEKVLINNFWVCVEWC